MVFLLLRPLELSVCVQAKGRPWPGPALAPPPLWAAAAGILVGCTSLAQSSFALASPTCPASERPKVGPREAVGGEIQQFPGARLCAGPRRHSAWGVGTPREPALTVAVAFALQAGLRCADTWADCCADSCRGSSPCRCGSKSPLGERSRLNGVNRSSSDTPRKAAQPWLQHRPGGPGRWGASALGLEPHPSIGRHASCCYGHLMSLMGQSSPPLPRFPLEQGAQGPFCPVGSGTRPSSRPGPNAVPQPPLLVK